MDAIVAEKVHLLISLVRSLDHDRATHIFPGGLPPLLDGIQNLAPNALISLLDHSLPEAIRLSSAQVILAILLDTEHLQRFGLVLSLSHTSIASYIQPLFEAIDQASNPEQIRRLGLITSRQIYFSGCNTYACAYHRIISTRNLLHALTGYAH
jgi:hypothetical protein